MRKSVEDIILKFFSENMTNGKEMSPQIISIRDGLAVNREGIEKYTPNASDIELAVYNCGKISKHLLYTGAYLCVFREELCYSGLVQDYEIVEMLIKSQTLSKEVFNVKKQLVIYELSGGYVKAFDFKNGTMVENTDVVKEILLQKYSEFYSRRKEG